MPQMKNCPDCRAPNPQSRTECYACGQLLAKKLATTALPSERSYPCVNCETQIPFSAKTCPGCGRIIADDVPNRLPQAVTAAVQAVPPSYWKIEPLPDGTIRMTRSGLGHLLSGFGEFGMGISSIAGFVILSLVLTIVRVSATNPAAFYVLRYLGGGTVLLAVLLVTTAMHREIRVGASLLERRTRFFGWQQVRRLTMGQFRVTTRSYHTRSGLQKETQLIAENLGQHTWLDSETHTDFSLTGGLFSTPTVSLHGEVRLLANYLSTITGWQLIDPEMGRF